MQHFIGMAGITGVVGEEGGGGGITVKMIIGRLASFKFCHGMSKKWSIYSGLSTGDNSGETPMIV